MFNKGYNISMITGLVKGLIIFAVLLFVISKFGKDFFPQNFKEVLTKKFLPAIEKTTKPTHQLISQGLTLGSAGEDVKILQVALSFNKNIYPSGIVSGFYGQLTTQAVKKLPEKYHLTQTGSIDISTANKFNEIFANKGKDYYLDLVPTPAIVQLNINNNTVIPDLTEWGQAKQGL